MRIHRIPHTKDCQDAGKGQATLKMVSLYILKQNSDSQTLNQHRLFESNFHLRDTIEIRSHGNKEILCLSKRLKQIPSFTSTKGVEIYHLAGVLIRGTHYAG